MKLGIRHKHYLLRCSVAGGFVPRNKREEGILRRLEKFGYVRHPKMFAHEGAYAATVKGLKVVHGKKCYSS